MARAPKDNKVVAPIINKYFQGAPAKTKRLKMEMTKITELPKSGCSKNKAIKSPRIVRGQTNSLRHSVKTCRVRARRCAKKITKAILANSEGCPRKSPTTSQRVPPLVEKPKP